METRVNTDRLIPFDVFEITFRHPNTYADPFHDVTLDVAFTAPDGETYVVGGFHYGSEEKPDIRVSRGQGDRRTVEYTLASHDTWKARFAPNALGRWTYSWTFTNNAGQAAKGEGEFQCVEGRVHNPGFLRQDPQNPFRWVFDDGSPYYPIGLQECLGDGEGTGSCIAGMSLEGPFRLDRQNRPTLPPGPLFVAGPSMNPQNGDTYFRHYARCGFNLFRFSQQNCSYVLYDDLDHYLPQQGIMTDELLQCVRKYGLRVMYGLFGYQKVFNDTPEDAGGMEQVKRFVKYSVDRWGAYVDIWEFLNEQKAADGWYEIMVPYLQSIDPYHHPITTSWERAELTGIDVNAPHWYEGYSNGLNCDASTAGNARNWKQHGKPVIVGEQGNHTSEEQRTQPGIGGVWDPGSAERMRIRNWSAFFNEIGFIFLATSYARDGHFMNIWLGPQEREYVRAMQDFSYALGPNLRMAEVSVSDPGAVRGYALASSDRAGAYLHHFRDHESPVRGLTITVDVPQAARGYWYSPLDASIVGTLDVPAGRQTLTVPDFTVDIALLITPAGPPDIDHDGKPNDVDTDDDNDGVADAEDAFPLEPEEWADVDGDLIGDSLDADLDGDGLGDDRNGNGTPDCEEMDFDGDGVPRSKAVPWDAFPLDPKEWRDTDGDGIGDNGDPDDDGDGFLDQAEARAKTDPLDRLSFPSRWACRADLQPARPGGCGCGAGFQPANVVGSVGSRRLEACATSRPQGLTQEWARMDTDDRFIHGFEKRRRRLPHVEEPGATYFLTFNLLRPSTVDLTRPDVAPIIVGALRYFDGDRYDLYDFTVMPDHVHLILKPVVREGRTERLSRIVHSLKSYTANEINRLVGRSGTLWQDEPYDHIIRNPADYAEIAKYILENAQAAGLAEDPTDWPWWGKGSGQF